MLTNQNQKLKGDHEMLMIPHRGEASEAEVDKLGKCDQTQPHTQTHRYTGPNLFCHSVNAAFDYWMWQVALKQMSACCMIYEHHKTGSGQHSYKCE